MAVYRTRVQWVGGHRGHLVCGNGAELDFSAPPALHGEEGVLTPEDALVAALNTCFHMMFIWAAERFHLDLVSYECEAEGTVRDLLDGTAEFTGFVLRPRVVVRGATVATVEKALRSARKYSLIAESLRAGVTVTPEILLQESEESAP